jgi:hypothetical protein
MEILSIQFPLRSASCYELYQLFIDIGKYVMIIYIDNLSWIANKSVQHKPYQCFSQISWNN